MPPQITACSKKIRILGYCVRRSRVRILDSSCLTCADPIARCVQNCRFIQCTWQGVGGQLLDCKNDAGAWGEIAVPASLNNHAPARLLKELVATPEAPQDSLARMQELSQVVVQDRAERVTVRKPGCAWHKPFTFPRPGQTAAPRAWPRRHPAVRENGAEPLRYPNQAEGG